MNEVKLLLSMTLLITSLNYLRSKDIDITLQSFSRPTYGSKPKQEKEPPRESQQ